MAAQRPVRLCTAVTRPAAGQHGRIDTARHRSATPGDDRFSPGATGSDRSRCGEDPRQELPHCRHPPIIGPVPRGPRCDGGGARMTSEGPHHPGHEPTEGAPGTGTSAPYGDRPPMGRPTTTPDFGWAPPPAAQNPGDGDGNGWSPQENAARSTPGTRQGQPGAVRASASVPGAIFPSRRRVVRPAVAVVPAAAAPGAVLRRRRPLRGWIEPGRPSAVARRRSAERPDAACPSGGNPVVPAGGLGRQWAVPAGTGPGGVALAAGTPGR